MAVKTFTKPMAAVFCLMLAGTMVRAASPVMSEPQKLQQVPPAPKAAVAAVEKSPVADLTSQTIQPCALTLAAENPRLAKEPSRNIPGTISVATENLSPTTQFVAVTQQSVAVPQNISASTTTEYKPEPSCAAVSPSAMNAVASNPCNNNCCTDSCCDVFKCCKCGPDGNFWLRDEYVGWWAQGGRLPPLVATSTDGTLPSNRVLYGDDTYNDGYRSGNWAQGGMWFDCCHTHGVQFDYFFAGQLSSPFFAASDGDPIITRPFIDASTGDPADQLVAFPGIVVGRISIDNHNSLQGAGVLGRCNICCSCCEDCCGNSSCTPKCWYKERCCRTDFVYGFRWYQFNDNLNIEENLVSVDPTSGIPIGTTIDVRDSFTTENNFYGFELGVIHQHWMGRWMTEGTAKVALGDMNTVVNINGSTTVGFPGQPTVVNEGGLLALQSNIGRYQENNFVAIPQVSLRLGYRMTDHITVMGGYTFMFFSELGRAGDQIDPVINTNLIPPVTGGGTRPAYNFNPSELVLQGVTIGAEINF